MSIESHGHVEHAEHQTPIKTPKQLGTVVLLAFAVPIIVIALLVTFVTDGKKRAAGSDAMSPQSVEARIAPVAGFEFKDAAGGGGVLRTGEQVFAAQCSACHASGAVGAPKFGDAAAWGPRITKGYEALLSSALKGKGAMSPQGGGEFSDLEIGRAVVHMANAGGAKFAEPAAGGAKEAGAKEGGGAVKTVAADGKALYEAVCQACHASGAAGAPKFGDKAAWAPRIKEGLPHLVASALKGKGAMPAKGGKADATEDEIRAAVEYIVSAAK